ncbi:hypothetical protein ABPG72_014933 [Tetrahymena utriculariae]
MVEALSSHFNHKRYDEFQTHEWRASTASWTCKKTAGFEYNSNSTIIFFTDGENNYSKYEKTLQKMKKLSQGQSLLICLGYGQSIKVDNLKKCLIAYNGNDFSKRLQNGKSIQTLYTVYQSQEILDAFKKISDFVSFQLDDFREKSNMMQYEKQNYKKILQEMELNVNNLFDQQIKSLKKQIQDLEKNSNMMIQDTLTFQNTIKDIQKKEIDQIYATIDQIKMRVIKMKNQQQNKRMRQKTVKQQLMIRKKNQISYESYI